MKGESQRNDRIEFEQGDVATDLEKDKRVVVVNRTEERADEYVVWETPGDDDPVCVNYFNEDYPRDDLVVEAVYVEATISDEDEVVREFEAGEIDEGLIYGFPASRLEK